MGTNNTLHRPIDTNNTMQWVANRIRRIGMNSADSVSPRSSWLLPCCFDSGSWAPWRGSAAWSWRLAWSRSRAARTKNMGRYCYTEFPRPFPTWWARTIRSTLSWLQTFATTSGPNKTLTPRGFAWTPCIGAGSAHSKSISSEGHGGSTNGRRRVLSCCRLVSAGEMPPCIPVISREIYFLLFW